jgi:cell wall-associated NlpC family hydrolase
MRLEMATIRTALLFSSAVVAVAGVGCSKAAPPVSAPGGPAPTAFERFCSHRLVDPPRLVLERPCGSGVAVLTDGARAVLVTGPERPFGEATAGTPVVTRSWVRVLPAPFSGTLDAATEAWVDRASRDAGADVLALAMQYIEGAPVVLDSGMQIAGDADYGPLSDLGARVEGADFNDYLGIRWTYPDGTVDRPKGEMLHSLDCSGYMRMIWGYRSGVPLAPGPVTGGEALPRRAVQMEASRFGVTIVAGGDASETRFGRLQAGDLVFFDADPDDGPAVDHVGMFLGLDQGGHLRFVSSRKSPNGPTLGDLHGASILDGTGLYAHAFRSARRL